MTHKPRSLLGMFLGERSRLVQRIKRIVDSDAVAEDLAQETFLKLWQRPSSGEDSAGLLYRTAQNLALDHLRAQGVRQRYQDSESLEPEAQAAANPERIAEAVERWQSLVEALETLPERPRQVFLLNRVEGETYAAIAERLGVSVSTVEKDMMRAMRLCREWQRRYRQQ